MNSKYPYLLDNVFLKEFDELRLKEQYVKIIVLDFLEMPVQEIQGQVISGSLNIDGQSSVRRTCTINFIADPSQSSITDINNLLSINKKIQLEIGFTNTTNFYLEYSKIWFPLGVYLIINPSVSHNNGGIQISLQLKDKMCLLNGECGGVIPAAVDFSTMETTDTNGNWVKIKPTIFRIIQELVNHYGGEQLGKIIIDGLDTHVKRVVQWQGDQSLYYIEQQVGADRSGPAVSYTLDANYAVAVGQNEKNFVHEYTHGDDIGYQLTDFVYPGDLTVDAGATVTSVLDTIKDTLGNFEYYYDLDGNFIFQEIKNYLNTTKSSSLLSTRLEQGGFLNREDTLDKYLTDSSKGKTVHYFSNQNIITSYSNAPQYSMIKNDFIVWGVRKEIDGLEYPIRYHLAIDKKPSVGNIYNFYFYFDETFDNYIPLESWYVYDFSESLNNNINVDEALKSKISIQERDSQQILCIITSYGIGAWKWFADKGIFKSMPEITLENKTLITSDWRSELYLQGFNNKADRGYYFTELKNEWPKVYNFLAEEITIVDNNGSQRKVWQGSFRKVIIENSTKIDYFLDFIDTTSEIGDLSVSQIGRRTKVLNDKSINCIFEPEIPDYILIKAGVKDTPLVLESSDSATTASIRQQCNMRGYKYLLINKVISEGVGIGGHFNSAFYAIQDLLYQYTSYNETITINCLPIYYLEPNTRIFVADNDSDILGDYVIKSFSIPLDINGTMSINAARALDKI